MARPPRPKTPFYRFNSSPEIIRLVVMMYVKFPLSLRNVEDLLHERGIDLCHETVRFAAFPHAAERAGVAIAAAGVVRAMCTVTTTSARSRPERRRVAGGPTAPAPHQSV